MQAALATDGFLTGGVGDEREQARGDRSRRRLL